MATHNEKITANNRKKAPPYIILPSPLRFDSTIPPAAKILYGEILTMSSKFGYCWASNEYFASLYGTTKETISRYISKLEKSKYIERKMTYKENSKEVDKRMLIPLLTTLPTEISNMLIKNATENNIGNDSIIKDNK